MSTARATTADHGPGGGTGLEAPPGVVTADEAAVEAAERAAPAVKRPSRLWVKISHAMLVATYVAVVVLACT
jgi:hypothetical protein